MNRGNTGLRFSVALAMVAIMAVTVPLAKADAVTAWNRTAGDIIVDSGMGPLPADRALAILHGAIYEAVNAITRRYPASGSGLNASWHSLFPFARKLSIRLISLRWLPSKRVPPKAGALRWETTQPQ